MEENVENTKKEKIINAIRIYKRFGWFLIVFLLIIIARVKENIYEDVEVEYPVSYYSEDADINSYAYCDIIACLPACVIKHTDTVGNTILSATYDYYYYAITAEGNLAFLKTDQYDRYANSHLSLVKSVMEEKYGEQLKNGEAVRVMGKIVEAPELKNTKVEVSPGDFLMNSMDEIMDESGNFDVHKYVEKKSAAESNTKEIANDLAEHKFLDVWVGTDANERINFDTMTMHSQETKLVGKNPFFVVLFTLLATSFVLWWIALFALRIIAKRERNR
ncbi:MAG: hypothetical protein MJ133_11820 [Lachnospiraceae bacterium]|nr:hypothetical protein [Lachnospiraceae bacterium]